MSTDLVFEKGEEVLLIVAYDLVTNKPICGMPKFERNHSDNIKDTYFCHLTADDIEEMHEQVQKGVGEFLIRIREVKE